ncbi:MAG: hypothetical protein JHD15_00715 [Phenylobacterium sp.]|uniref:hypothetical protein n=1 Tax=Phenylobacterium sp. TaxID=1871053 RepID=UPI001A2F7054|nr:hypothetical protein [Phenylobacterium sp.]MBJ7408878.1 hypothetical protein [Phenylobacterium sp.]
MYESFARIWGDHYAASLTAREIAQFQKAASRQSCDLIDKVIKPMLLKQGSYICLSRIKNHSGRGPADTEDHVLNGDNSVSWATFQYFTNPLRRVAPNDPAFHSPKDRVHLDRYVVLTMEYDVPDVAFFKQQLGWFRSTKNQLDSPIGNFVRSLRQQFRDFVGLNVTYSGAKSFHYHFVFTTDLIRSGGDALCSVRNGLQTAWRRLSVLMTASPPLAIPDGCTPDPALAQPEAFRRLPLGSREIVGPHMFAVPKGEIVPQVVMWEHITTGRAGKDGVSASLFEPSQFRLPHTATVPRTQSRTQTAPTMMATAGSLAHCEKRIRAFFPEGSWPSFVGFRDDGAELRAYFTNSPHDRNAASYMAAGFATVMICGDNPLALTNARDGFGQRMPRLPRSLGEMIEQWTAEYDADQVEPFSRRTRTPIEDQFARKATDYTSATTAISNTFDDLMLDGWTRRSTHLVMAPEGVSKTRSLIAKTRGYWTRLRRDRRPSLIMYAFPTYDLAEEKAREFNVENNPRNLNSSDSLKAVVLPSFSRLYANICARIGIAAISTGDAAKNGYASRMAAIQALQPQVIGEMRAFHAQLRREIGRCQPVLFTVHDVAHGWQKNSPTRLMFCPAYWREPCGETAQERALRHQTCRDWTDLGLLIHDEMSAESLVRAIPAETLRWVEGMKAIVPSWSSSDLTAQFTAFTRHAASQPPPTPLKFETAREIAEAQTWDFVTTEDNAEYGRREPRIDARTQTAYADIYEATAGGEWAIHVKPWPFETAFRVLVLTTEMVPTWLAHRIGRWSITELDTPLIQRDSVETHVSNEVRADRLAELLCEWQASHLVECGRTLHAISNKAAAVTNTRTHAAAKGSNSYIGQDVIQTMTMMPPEQFEYYQALNAWTGRTDLVRTRHIDEFNQSAGRNLGFRGREDARHILLINATLWDSLEGGPFAGARYAPVEVLSRRGVSGARKLARQARIDALGIKARPISEVRAALSRLLAA